ncbi:sugar ABC transporter substrate-binding protein [Clostridium sp.]|uniref:ABC transporter substrate-binding protein n=1 Tax=Clostridium sp. TaxID=1506 RepID=UPI0026292568|nr:sugar ABC transporter substrate-binding protein [Clostridium sp.]
MKIKKILSLVSVLCLGLSIVSCSGNSNNTTGNDKKQLRFAIWDIGQKPGFEEVAKAFNKKNPNVEVIVEVTPYKSYFTTLDTAAQGNNLPDIITINAPNFLKYQEGGKLMDLSSYEMNLDEFNPAVRDIYTVSDKPYALPRDFDAIGMWYNKTLFKELGLEIPKTYKEMVETAKKLKENDPEIIPISISYADNQAGYWNLVIQEGGKIVNDDGKTGWGSSEALEAMTFYNSLVKDGLSEKPIKLEGIDNITSVANKKIGMFYSGTWTTAEVATLENKDDIDVAPIPLSGKNDISSVVHGVGTAVAANTKNPDEAKMFIEFMATDEANKIIAEKSGVMPAKNGFGDTLYNANLNLTGLKATIESASKGAGYFKSSKTGWDSKEVELITKMLNGDATPEDTVKMLVEEANKILK